MLIPTRCRESSDMCTLQTDIAEKLSSLPAIAKAKVYSTCLFEARRPEVYSSVGTGLRESSHPCPTRLLSFDARRVMHISGPSLHSSLEKGGALEQYRGSTSSRRAFSRLRYRNR